MNTAISKTVSILFAIVMIPIILTVVSITQELANKIIWGVDGRSQDQSQVLIEASPSPEPIPTIARKSDAMWRTYTVGGITFESPVGFNRFPDVEQEILKRYGGIFKQVEAYIATEQNAYGLVGTISHAKGSYDFPYDLVQRIR
jgi:hypothetical protein